jgi:hypothetical protein
MTSAQLPKVTSYLQRAQEENDTISWIKVPWLMFDIQSQYSMINYLRLSHKPNVKHNITWNEINAAWSQAAQFLYIVGGTKYQLFSIFFSSCIIKLLNFFVPIPILPFSAYRLQLFLVPSEIVPLSTCAKIIEAVGTKTRQLFILLATKVLSLPK